MTSATRAPKRILVTCVGSGVGQSVVDSLKHFKDEYFLIGSDHARYSYSVPDCDDFIGLPAIAAPEYLDALLAACARLAVDVVIPGHDLELPMLARHVGRFEAANVQVIIGNAGLVGLLRDKLAWSREFRKHTDRVVMSCSVAEYRRDGAKAGIDLPAIAKPSGGSASSGLRILHAQEDAQDLPEDYIVQPFLFPADDDPQIGTIRAAVAAGRVVQTSEISVQLLYSRRGELLARFASRNRLKAGVPVEIVPVDSAEIWSAVDEVAAVLADYEPRGPFNLQGRVTSRGLVFFEMNPRFTGITGNRSQFGFNEVALAVDSFTGAANRKLYVNNHKVGVRQVACRSWPKERYAFGAALEERRRPQSIVVLGATSWYARHFIAERRAAGHQIAAVCREQALEAAGSLYGGSSGVEVVSDRAPSLKDVFGWADVLVNFASGRPPHGPDAILAGHLYQTRMLDLADVQEIPRIINISSQSVYAAAGDVAKDENAQLDAASPYAFSKCAIEDAVRCLARRHAAVRAVSLRVARLYGAASGLRENEFPHQVVKSAILGKPIELRGAANVLDLIDIRDAVSAVSFFVDAALPIWGGEAFNVGSAEAVTLGAYVAAVDRISRQRLGRPLQVQERDAAVTARSGLDCRKLGLAGWAPALALDQSINDLFEYFENAAR